MSLGKSQKGKIWKGVYDNVRRFKPEWQRTFLWVKRLLMAQKMRSTPFVESIHSRDYQT